MLDYDRKVNLKGLTLYRFGSNFSDMCRSITKTNEKYRTSNNIKVQEH